MITPLDILSLETWTLIIIIFFLIRYYINSKWQVMRNLGIPHDPPSILNMGNLGKHFEKPEIFFMKDWELMKKYGRVYGVYNGLNPRIGISDPEVLKKIMIRESHNFSDRERSFQNVSGKVMGSALATVSGEKWKRIRHTLSPTFSSSKLKEMFVIVDQCTDLLVENLKRTAAEHNGEFDTKDIFGKLSLDSICSAAFGVNVHSQDHNEKESKVVIMARKAFDRSLVKNMFFLFFVIFPVTEKIAGFFGYSIFDHEVTDYFASLTDHVVQKQKESEHQGKMDIMRSMLQSEVSEDEAKHATKGLTRHEITGNSVFMMMAGYETTSSAMIFLAYNLACHKQNQELAREEIKTVLEEHGGLTYEAINQMKYLMQCLNESMRLYPPAVRNSRQCSETITIDGITILEGMVVDIPTYGMARDEKFWDEPLEFKPERMEDMSKIDPMVFQPFGAGPRNCIGMRFALMEIKLAFCKLLLNFELDACSHTPKPPAEIIFKLSMKPKEEIYLKAIPLKE